MAVLTVRGVSGSLLKINRHETSPQRNAKFDAARGVRRASGMASRIMAQPRIVSSAASDAGARLFGRVATRAEPRRL